MATLAVQLAKTKRLQPNKLSTDLFRFIRSIEKDLVQLNRDQLREKSSDIYGNAIGFYSYATEQITKGRKKAGEPFDAYDTGAFQKGIYMQEVSGVIRFLSKDPKTQIILNSKNWLSSELFGLTDENLKAVIENQLLPFFIDNTREILDI